MRKTKDTLNDFMNFEGVFFFFLLGAPSSLLFNGGKQSIV